MNLPDCPRCHLYLSARGCTPERCANPEGAAELERLTREENTSAIVAREGETALHGLNLLPCPFCGRVRNLDIMTEIKHPATDPTGYLVFCSERTRRPYEGADCSTGPRRPTAPEAIAAWNLRARLTREDNVRLGEAIKKRLEMPPGSMDWKAEYGLPLGEALERLPPGYIRSDASTSLVDYEVPASFETGLTQAKSPSDLDTFRAMLERAGVKDSGAYFVEQEAWFGDETVRITFDGDLFFDRATGALLTLDETNRRRDAGE